MPKYSSATLSMGAGGGGVCARLTVAMIPAKSAEKAAQRQVWVMPESYA